MILRPYQHDAVVATYRHLRQRVDAPCIVIPTAGGKTLVIAAVCIDAVMKWGGRVLVVAHVKELLEQTADKLRRMCPELEIGIYSAGLGRRDTKQPVIVAGIQSIHKRASELGHFDLVIVDEAHLIPPEGEGMYHRFLASTRALNPNVRVIGLTATPFRMSSGMICSPDNVLNTICYEITVRELIRDEYLCPLINKAGLRQADTGDLKVRAGEFVPSEVEQLMDQRQLVEAACSETVELTADRKACLIFASGIRHAQHIARELEQKHGLACGFVCAKTPADERATLLKRFHQGHLPYLVNVNVLTTGFDAPNVDCVVLLRPTLSPGLYYQMVGRGFRLHPDKENCLVLDYGGNILRHGPVDQVQIKPPGEGTGEPPAKECPDCHAVVAAGYARCPHCGHVFPPKKQTQHSSKASEAEVLSYTNTTYVVQDIRYTVHTKYNADEDHPKSMRVDYFVGLGLPVSEWICVEHTGYARSKAEQWWRQRSPDPVPDTAQQAVDIANSGGLCTTELITVRYTAGERYGRITAYELGEVPEPVPIGGPDVDLGDLPF